MAQLHQLPCIGLYKPRIDLAFGDCAMDEWDQTLWTQNAQGVASTKLPIERLDLQSLELPRNSLANLGKIDQ